MSHAAGEAAWDWDLRTGRIQRGGALLAMTGFGPEEAPPDPAWWNDRIHPEDRSSVLAALDAALVGERRELVLLYRFRRKDGAYMLMLDRAFVLGVDAASPERIVGFAREISNPVPQAAPDPSLAHLPLDHVLTELLERSRLLESVRRDRDRLVAHSRTIVASLEEERRRVSRELHDEIGQLLTSLRLALRTGAPARVTVDEILDELFARVRDITTRLRPPMLEDLGLGPSLTWHCERFSSQTGVRVHLTITGLEMRYLPKVELAVYRIVQEALTNVARHAHVARARIAVRGSRDRVAALVVDRGIGFAHDRVQPRLSGGLTGMSERAASVGGRVEVSSTPGRGTRVSLSVPIHEKEASSSHEVL